MIEEVNKLPVKVVEEFLQDRDEKKYGIPHVLACYIIELNDAVECHKKNGSITNAAKALQSRHRHLSISTAKQRIYDSIKYLQVQSNVTASEWYMYFADEMMKLRDINLLKRDIKEARVCEMLALQYRIKASANIIDPNRLKYKPLIISPDLEKDRMGIKTSGGILNAYRKLLTIIEQRDVPESEKLRLKDELERELNIKDSDYECV